MLCMHKASNLCLGSYGPWPPSIAGCRLGGLQLCGVQALPTGLSTGLSTLSLPPGRCLEPIFLETFLVCPVGFSEHLCYFRRFWIIRVGTRLELPVHQCLCKKKRKEKEKENLITFSLNMSISSFPFHLLVSVNSPSIESKSFSTMCHNIDLDAIKTVIIEHL